MPLSYTTAIGIMKLSNVVVPANWNYEIINDRCPCQKLLSWITTIGLKFEKKKQKRNSNLEAEGNQG